MKKAILAAVAVWTLAVVPLVAGNHSAGWDKRLGEAVNDVSRAAEAVKSLPEGERAEFAAAVLAALAAKERILGNQQATADEFGKAAAGLLAGAGGARSAVLAAIAEATANGGDAAKVALLAGSVVEHLK
jgi:hypothetical protein